MSEATLTSKGQITIPKDVRDRLGIGAGDRVEFVEIESGVFKFVPATNDISALKGIISKPKKIISLQAMDDAIKNKARNKR
ncbi:MAG: AbrB/MazE/SpoVT family DNA-binding domain-containing protein [Thiohalomonadales bacterium]